LAKRGWGGPRRNSGGKRKGAGRKYKFYSPLVIDYCPYASKDTLLRALDDLYRWLLEDRIDTRRAATVAHILEIMAKIQTPSLIEEKIDELGAKAERLGKALADRIVAEAETYRTGTTTERYSLADKDSKK
jgi:hypothetical protein